MGVYLAADREQAAALLTIYMVNFLQHCQAELRDAFWRSPLAQLQLIVRQDFPLWGELNVRAAAQEFSLDTYLSIITEIKGRLSAAALQDQTSSPRSRLRRQNERLMRLDVGWLQACSFERTAQIMAAQAQQLKEINPAAVKAAGYRSISCRSLPSDPRYK